MDLTAEQIIEILGLRPHPEGGHYRETWRHDAGGTRGAGTAIYFLLREGEVSAWHRIDSAEIWHFYSGAPLELKTHVEGEAVETVILGPNLADRQAPQFVAPPGAWQSARSLGAWTLVGCTVSPAFEFEHFELAPPGWNPSEAAER